ncbi:DHP-2 protein [Aphelenchoides avenae]|nr:DHP-2 protein [Aphelenchus avenae]
MAVPQEITQSKYTQMLREFANGAAKTGAFCNAVGENLPTNGVGRIVGATDRYVIPGGIDPHTHMQLPYMGEVSVDDFYTGTRAALAGGTTMIIDFAIPFHGRSPIEAYKEWRSWADPKVCCDYGLTVAVSTWNEQMEAEMTELIKPEYGINSFKFYFTYDGLMVRDEEFFAAAKHCAKIGAFARVHAENGPIIKELQKDLLEKGVTGPEGHWLSRPEELEAEAVNRACVLAAQANCPLYVVHVMSKEAAEVIVKHRQKGHVVFGEPIAPGLARSAGHCFEKDSAFLSGHIMSPPISRDPQTPVTLMDYLARGDLHLTGSDNASWSCHQKTGKARDFTQILSGVNGVEDRMSVSVSFSSEAARIFNIYPRKGRIAVGSDADILVWNPSAVKTISARTHHQATDFNIFEGMEVHGIAEVTIAGGKVAWEDGKFTVEAGSGKFVPMRPWCAHVFQNAKKDTDSQ